MLASGLPARWPLERIHLTAARGNAGPVPVAGSFVGSSDALISMTVEVSITG